MLLDVLRFLATHDVDVGILGQLLYKQPHFLDREVVSHVN